MTKQCPACGTEVENEIEKCPDCGFDFSNKNIEPDSSTLEQASESVEESEKKESTSNFINKEKNENIEWSELKDMSIGHVMNMFNEKEAAAAEETDLEKTIIETFDEKEIELIEETAISETKHSESETEIKTDITVDEETIEKVSTEDASAFQEYLQEHRSDIAIEKEDNTETENNPQSDESEKSMSEEKEKNIDQSIQKNSSDEDKAKEDKNDKHSVIDETLENKSEHKEVDLGKTQPFIPSKSKRPEEIEMDEAPIFFKDKDEKPGPKNIPSNFVKTESKVEKPTITARKSEAPKEKKAVPKKNNYKKTAIILGAAIVLGGAGWYFYDQSQKGTTGSTEVSKNVETLAEETKESLQNYFTNDKQEFIKADMVSVSPTTIKDNLDKLKDSSDYKTLEATYQKVVSKQKTITQVNQLFEKPIIAGDKLNDVVLASDTEIKIEKMSGTNEFDKLINQAIDQATNQYNQLKKAQQAVAVFYQNGAITDSLTQEAYNTAKTEVDLVKSGKLKESLLKALTEAEKKLVAQNEATVSVAEPEVAQESDTTTADQTNQEQVIQSNGTPDASGFTGPNSQGIYTEPVYTVNPADVADASNPAWIWAPGVQEKVIATCIERGYITAGNYSLQPARIVNGEGYYNLYGGDGQYLVTINAQTGWFKGNASRNAGR
ncbi:cell division site-positioning protein MapZ family protein [Enterococcus sp. LJL99]